MENWTPRRARRGKVQTSSFKEQIEEQLETSSPAQVSKWLQDQGERISERTLRSYRNNIVGPKKALQRGALNSRYFEVLNGKIDALQEFYRLTCIQIERLSRGVSLEESKTAPIGAVSREVDLLRRILLDIINLEVQLGIRKTGKEESNQALTDEQLKNLLLSITDQSESSEGTTGAAKEEGSDQDSKAGV